MLGDAAETAVRDVAAQASEQGYRLLFEGHPLPMWVLDRATLRFMAVNDAAIEKYGYTEQEFLAKTIADIRAEREVAVFARAVGQRPQEGRQREIWRHRKKDGCLIDVEIESHPLEFRGVQALLVAAHDVTEQVRSAELLQNSENKYRVLFEDSADAYWLMDESGIVDCNSAALHMFGYEEGMRMPHPAAMSPPYQPDGRSSKDLVELRIEEALRHGKERFEWMHQRRNGETFPAEVCLTALTLSGKRMLLSIVRDITDRKQAEERIQFLAYYDALTGLPNRRLVQDRLEKALESARRRDEKVALLFLDLDRFKLYNDSLGHGFGDALLQEVAQRIRRCTRKQDTVGRIGGDEFLIVLNGVKDANGAAIAAGRFIKAMTREFAVEGRPVNISCSVGVSLFPEHGTDVETLIKNADTAMYCAKDDGRNDFCFFTEEMHAQAMERLTIENNLRLALERGEFFLAYQPQFDAETCQITGVEALLRWQQPELGLIPPDKFISIAENTGLILPLGEWVLQTACAQARKWQQEGLQAVPVAVNVSAVQFCHEGFVGMVRRVLEETGLPPQYLELELTEGLLLSNADVTLTVLRELRDMGLKLAIDDFGTGYSSLSYLKQFRVNKLKIDRSFVRDVANDADDAAIAIAIISMARSLKLKVIAEGVEDEAQMSFLRKHLCDEIQGYYFSRPISASDMGDKLRPRRLGPGKIQMEAMVCAVSAEAVAV